MPPADPQKVTEMFGDLEEMGIPTYPERDYETEEDREIESDQTAENEIAQTPEVESENEPEQEAERELEELELINPDTGEPVPHQPDPELIPLEDLLEKMYDQQQGEISPESEQTPKQEPELISEQESEQTPNQEPELISEQESEQSPKREPELISEQESEQSPKQEPELVPEQIQKREQKKKRIKAKELELITDPEELGDYKHYEYSHIVGTKYDYIFSHKKPQKQEKKTKKKKPQKTPKKKPEKIKQLEVITDPEELGDYKHYEYSHIVNTKYDYKLPQKHPKKSEKKTKKTTKNSKKIKIKVKHLELATDPGELGESKTANSQKKSEESVNKKETSEKSSQKKRPKRVISLELITDPKEFGESELIKKQAKKPAEKSEKKISSESKKVVKKIHSQKKREKSNEKKDELVKKEIQVQKPASKSKVIAQHRQKRNQKIQKNIEMKKELQQRYRQETGKRPLYAKKETKEFLKWLEKQKNLAQKKKVKKEFEKSKEDWEVLLEKWIQQANDGEISGEIKKELMDIIQKYHYYKVLYEKLIKLLNKANPTNDDIEIIENLSKKLEKMTNIQEEMFKNLNAFQTFYTNKITWFKHEILAEKLRFTTHLTQKLKKLKVETENRENSENIPTVSQSWKELLKNKLDSIEKLSEESKSRLRQVLRKEKIREEEIRVVVSILKKLHINQLIEIFGESLASHTKNYVRWGWDFYEYIKNNMLIAYFNKFEFKLKEVLRENLYKSKELNMNEKSKLIKITQKKYISEKEIKVIKSLLGSLSKRELISLLKNEKDSQLLDFSALQLNDPFPQNMHFNFRNGSDVNFRTDIDNRPTLEQQNKEQKVKISTIEYINYIIGEITKLSPQEWISKQGKNKGKIRISILSKKFFGFSQGSLKNTIQNIKSQKYPDYLFAAETLDYFIKQVNIIFGEKAQNIIDRTNLYRQSNPDMRVTLKQQWQRHNPDLNVHYFEDINTIEKAFYFGFFCADVLVRRKAGGKEHYSIRFQLAGKDAATVKAFAVAISIDPEKVKVVPRTQNDKTYLTATLEFASKEMVKNLYDHHIFGSKSEIKELPEFSDVDGGPSGRELLLAWIRGYYEGDGTAKQTTIGASSKELLEKIKEALNIEYPVRPNKDGTFFQLTLGSISFNEMTYLVKQEGTFLLERKDKTFNMKFEALSILKSKLKLLGIGKQELLKMLSQHPQIKIIKVIDSMFKELGLKNSQHVVLAWQETALYTFRQLRNEWGITSLPPRSSADIEDNGNYLGHLP